MAVDTCMNNAYKQAHPEECKYITDTDHSLLYLGGGAVTIGGIAVLAGMMTNTGNSSHGNSVPAVSSQPVRTISPTTIVHDAPAPDFTATDLSLITSNAEYVRNAIAYNDIQLAYSIARGYTGVGTNIAVFDTDLNAQFSHGAAVMAVASGPIAPNANIEHHMIAYDDSTFKSYSQIGNIISNTTDANVYNNSWNVSGIHADEITSRTQLVSKTSQNFVNAISNAATQNDAIFVWAAGNDSYTDSTGTHHLMPSGMLSAMPRVMPELAGHFVNVVAWDSQTRALADYSNACGVTKNYCITAPGTMKTPDNHSHVGTSFAAPVVSAAIAVIREAWPYLTSTQITDILFTTAADLGDPGIDDIYGHGMLDLEHATRPVGELTIAVANDMTQPLHTANVSPQIAHAIESANPKMAFFDTYGRTFETNISDNISVRNRGLGFERLRADNAYTKINFGALEFGMYRSDMLNGTGFLATDGETTTTYIAANHSFNFHGFELFTHSQLGAAHPIASSESMISEFSNVYTAAVSVGINTNDLSLSVGIPDAVVHGNMNLHTATGRRPDGTITYSDYKIDMMTTPSIEYTAKWRFMTAGFVDNPYSDDEFYIFAKTKIHF